MRILACSLVEAKRRYSSRHVLAILSIGDPGSEEEVVRDDIPYHRCEIKDTVSPSVEAVTSAIEWLRGLDYSQMGKMVIHCKQGQSRSVAFAAVAAHLAGSEDPFNAFHVFSRHVMPSLPIVKIADEALGSELQEAYKVAMPGAYRMWSIY